VFQRAVVAQAPKDGAITAEMSQQAEWVSGIKLSDDDRKALIGRINSGQRQFNRLRQVPLTNDVPPAFAFIADQPAGPEGTSGRLPGRGVPPFRRSRTMPMISRFSH